MSNTINEAAKGQKAVHIFVIDSSKLNESELELFRKLCETLTYNKTIWLVTPEEEESFKWK